jgi:nucleoside-diphosphate-sugar epimerase
MRVFVTGATGALGRSAVPALLAAGHEVTGLARSDAKSAWLESTGAQASRADLLDSDALTAAMRGHDAVCNLATHIPVGAKAALPTAWAEDRRIREQGSLAVATAAIAAGVPRIVQEGVAFVYAEPGKSDPDRELTEDSPLDPHYPPAVLVAQRNAERVQAAGGTTVVLRFGWFYGDDANTLDTLRHARAGDRLPLGRLDDWVTRVNVADTGTAVVSALTAPGGVYNVAQEPARRRALADGIARAAGVDAVKSIPAPVLKLAGSGPRTVLKSLRVSSAKFRDGTGWRPAHPTILDGWPTL